MSILSDVINPLKLDLKKFRAEFARRAAMTSYARAMDTAVDAKADKWLSYTPLTKEQLFDNPAQDTQVTIILPLTSGRLAHARSTYHGAPFYAQRTVMKHPTETLGILHAMGFFVLPSDFTFIRHIPDKELRWCYGCKKRHDVTAFAPNKNFPGGLAFWCREYQTDAKKRVYRKAG